jgi:hypothetical protein
MSCIFPHNLPKTLISYILIHVAWISTASRLLELSQLNRRLFNHLQTFCAKCRLCPPKVADSSHFFFCQPAKLMKIGLCLHSYLSMIYLAFRLNADLNSATTGSKGAYMDWPPSCSLLQIRTNIIKQKGRRFAKHNLSKWRNIFDHICLTTCSDNLTAFSSKKA